MATEKFKALVHFLVHECREHPGRLGAIRLNKALWYTDVTAYKMNGTSVTGEDYVKRKKGPVPAHILATLRELANEGKIVIREPQFMYEPRLFISMTTPDTEHLSDDERDLAKSILDTVCGFTANEISDLTHDVIWNAASEGEKIPLFATLVSERGEVSGDVREWAKQVVEKIERRAA